LLECGCRRIISLMTVEPSSTDPLHLLVLTLFREQREGDEIVGSLAEMAENSLALVGNGVKWMGDDSVGCGPRAT
jgi:hypothetical protein